MFAIKFPFYPFIGSSKRKLLHYLTNFSMPSGNLFQEFQSTLSQRLNMLLNAVIVLRARLKSELLNFKVSFIYFVYLPPIFLSSQHHILSRMRNRIFTIVVNDSLKIINFKRLKEIPRRHYKYILHYFYAFCY